MKRLVLLGLITCSTCARTELLPPACVLRVGPSLLDFGTVAPGDGVKRTVTLGNDGSDVCGVAGIALGSDTDPGFSLQAGSPTSLSVAPGAQATISITFAPQSASLPLARAGALVFRALNAGAANVTVRLAANVASGCVAAVAPSEVDFGHVPLGGSGTRSVTVSNTGTGPCELTDVAIGNGSDPGFGLVDAPSVAIVLQPGAMAELIVEFDASDAAAPHHRTGTLVFQTTDPARLQVNLPLAADIDVGCDLTISPPSLSFGNVIPNSTVAANVTLGNDGSKPCPVSQIALGPDTDPEFELDGGQPTAFTLDPGDARSVTVRFTAFDTEPPHLKTGTLEFQTGNPHDPHAVVPLSAFVNTACVEASRWIYTVDANGVLSRFDPSTLTFTDIGTLDCADGSGPFSMAVDQNAVAWVVYADGELFQVDTATAACQSTTFQAGQQGLVVFGMGFVFDPTTGIDTLYIAGGASLGITQSTLATIAFPSLEVSSIGQINEGFAELTGTGDGGLWGFYSDFSSTTGTLVQIDPTNAAILERYTYSVPSTGNYAIKFWGGSFWIFLANSVYQVSRDSPETITTAIPDTNGRIIVGAGVSTCAPVH